MTEVAQLGDPLLAHSPLPAWLPRMEWHRCHGIRGTVRLTKINPAVARAVAFSLREMGFNMLRWSSGRCPPLHGRSSRCVLALRYAVYSRLCQEESPTFISRIHQVLPWHSSFVACRCWCTSSAAWCDCCAAACQAQVWCGR